MSGAEIGVLIGGGLVAVTAGIHLLARCTSPKKRPESHPDASEGVWKEGKKTFYDPMYLPIAQTQAGVALVHFQGDITSVLADVMCNSCFGGWLIFRGQGVDRSITRSAGWRLRARSLFRWSQVGKVFVSPGYSSKASRIYDVRAPKEVIELNNLYRAILEQARKDGAEVITLPSFGTNDFGINIETAAPLAVESVKTWLDENVGTHVLKRIIFVTFTDADTEVYTRALAPVSAL